MTRIATGVRGLDQIIEGGLIGEGAYLVRGGPGQGKTTLGLHFLCAAKTGETALFIGFQESDAQLRHNAGAIGLDTSGVHFLNLAPDEHFFTQQEKYDVFSSAEVEEAPLTARIVETVEALQPVRVFVDSLTQLRFLTADVFQYRKEVLSFLSFLKQRNATILFSSEHSPNTPDDDLQFLADGVLSIAADENGQFLSIEKLRGSNFTRGRHQLRNGCNGLEVFPHPVPPLEEIAPGRFHPVRTGIAALDDILGGGLESGTISLITGPSGIGKSTLAACIAAATARNEGHVAFYLFEEEISSLCYRCDALDIDLQTPHQTGRLALEQIEPLRYLADEFAAKVYRDVVANQTRLVVLDSTAGFQLTLVDESVKSRLHALTKSLSRINVSVLLVNETASLFGENSLSEKGISYLADNVIVMRYLESEGAQSSSLQVMKKRLSDFDRHLYAFKVGPSAIRIGAPCHEGQNK